MKKVFLFFLVTCAMFLFVAKTYASPLDYTVLQLGSHNENTSIDTVPHILIIGGIQGDEPGGFNAAALIGTHYRFKNGYVTIIPNLNFLSIIDRSRGSYGDMNRKFAKLDEKDPDFATVRKVQEMVSSPEVDLILNLHDGSGFYSPQYISELKNPKRWGNSIIIDQEQCNSPKYSELGEIGRKVATHVQANLLHKSHSFNLHNTETAKGDKEMEKTLTWFAIGQGKPAFGIEASKNLNVPERVYYHLQAIEVFFRHVGIEYERDFELDTKSIKKTLSSNIYLGFMNNRLVLPLEDIRRPQLGVFPMEKDYEVHGNSPILTAIAKQNTMQVHYGNNRLTNFNVEWVELDTSLEKMEIELDGKIVTAKFGDILYAKEYAKLIPQEGYRLNAIGAVVGDGPRGDESGIKIYKKDFQSRFSLDKNGSQYRLEVYKGKKYVGTFVLEYSNTKEKELFSPLGTK